MTGRKDIYAAHIHGLPDSTWRQNSNEKREQKAAAAEISDNNSENSSENPNTSDNQSSERQNTTETEPEITETRKFVICPNCGEKIWL